MVTLSIDMLPLLVIPTAMLLDVALGDPRALPHPIRWMGWSIQTGEPIFRKLTNNRYLTGALFAASLILGCWGFTWLVCRLAQNFHPVAGFIVQVTLVFFSLSARSLWNAATEIHLLLKQGHVDQARTQLDRIVGRDVAHYEAGDIARATVETVAENFVDGVLSPLFYAVIGGAPMAMAYKMINTLDSMVGYKNDRYCQFGWAAARIDDGANFIPARLAVVIIALAAMPFKMQKSVRALTTAINEGSHHRSPNAGYPEAAFAGVLGVQLNGPNYYEGVRVDKPYIGVALGRVQVHHVQKACVLMALSTLVSFAFACAVSVAMAI